MNNVDMNLEFPKIVVSEHSTATPEEVVSFYNDLLNQIVQNDRVLLNAFLNGPPLSDDQVTAIARWSNSIEPIVQMVMARNFETGMLPQ